MEITTDIYLRGENWAKVIDDLGCIFSNKTNYSLYILCLSIGIMYDKRISKFEDKDENPRFVPRNVIHNNDGGKLDTMYQAIILSTKTENFTEDQRLEMAFGDNPDTMLGMKKIDFLTEFANYGVTELVKLIGHDYLESMENISQFLLSSVEGTNFDVDSISDEELIDE